MGSPAGSRKDLQDTLEFAATHDVRPKVTRMPLEDAGKARALTPAGRCTHVARLTDVGPRAHVVASRAMFEALVREFYPKVTLTDAEREAEIRELEYRHATRDQCMTVEEVIVASKELGPI